MRAGWSTSRFWLKFCWHLKSSLFYLLHLCFVISFVYLKILKNFKIELEKRNQLHLSHLCALSHFCSNYIFIQTCFSLTLRTCICTFIHYRFRFIKKNTYDISVFLLIFFFWRTTIQTRELSLRTAARAGKISKYFEVPLTSLFLKFFHTFKTSTV